ncbi:MAG: hypothetical protein RMM30_07800 [Armatimonadota bacterium]|nr:hypothetical protein [Armatimonadota bacterium]MDW8156469.1 hypothetical protein [Armatimonadota bacterium]
MAAGRRPPRHHGWTTRAWRHLRWGAGLGVAFLGAQAGGWWWLSSSGVGLASSPGASYFYVLSGAHLAHVLGGLAWWGWLLLGRGRRADATRVSALSVYWHFLAALWVWLFAVLFTR